MFAIPLVLASLALPALAADQSTSFSSINSSGAAYSGQTLGNMITTTSELECRQQCRSESACTAYYTMSSATGEAGCQLLSGDGRFTSIQAPGTTFQYLGTADVTCAQYPTQTYTDGSQIQCTNYMGGLAGSMGARRRHRRHHFARRLLVDAGMPTDDDDERHASTRADGKLQVPASDLESRSDALFTVDTTMTLNPPVDAEVALAVDRVSAATEQAKGAPDHIKAAVPMDRVGAAAEQVKGAPDHAKAVVQADVEHAKAAVPMDRIAATTEQAKAAPDHVKVAIEGKLAHLADTPDRAKAFGEGTSTSTEEFAKTSGQEATA